ncbi:hypothetical protein GW17_00058010, partial [Ensete ventricosum]
LGCGLCGSHQRTTAACATASARPVQPPTAGIQLLPLAREAAACAAFAARSCLHVRPPLDAVVAYARPTQCLPGPSAASLTLLICMHTRCCRRQI